MTIYEKIRETVSAIQDRSGLIPQMGLVLGSGLGKLTAQVEDQITISYTDLPHFHGTSIEGHEGQLVLGRFLGIPVVVLQGRFHRYEGYPMEDVVFPTRAICGLGIHTLILTNAAGGVNTRYRPGDLMAITDHINLMGDNPLMGPNLAQLGPRFPDMSEAYSRAGVETLAQCAQEIGLELHQGVYAGLLGPTYETPAEVRMLRTLGADAVGMSTVPESIAANHLGVRVIGISCITNLAAGLSPQKLTHQEVIDNSKIGAEKMEKLLISAIPKLNQRSKQHK